MRTKPAKGRRGKTKKPTGRQSPNPPEPADRATLLKTTFGLTPETLELAGRRTAEILENPHSPVRAKGIAIRNLLLMMSRMSEQDKLDRGLVNPLAALLSQFDFAKERAAMEGTIVPQEILQDATHRFFEGDGRKPY